MTPEELTAALAGLPPEPPRSVSSDAVLKRAGSRRRKRQGAAIVTAAGVAGVVAVVALVPGSSGSGHGRPVTAAAPPQRVTIQGTEFVRRQQQPFVLQPGVRAGDALGLFVTVPVTYIPDGPCATAYLPFVTSQSSASVTVTTWQYTPPTTPRPGFACAGVGHGDHEVRLQLTSPLGNRPLFLRGTAGPRPVLLLGATPASDPRGSGLAPAHPTAGEICLQDHCVAITDSQLLQDSAAAVDSALPVRPGGGSCSNAGRTDNVDRTYVVRFTVDGRTGPRIAVPLGCSPLGVIGAPERYGFPSGSGTADTLRIAYDQQITPESHCLGIGGPSGGPVTKDYVGLTLAQAQARATATNNDVLRIAGQDGTCVGVVRDHVINRVNVYLEHGVITAAKSF